MFADFEPILVTFFVSNKNQFSQNENIFLKSINSSFKMSLFNSCGLPATPSSYFRKKFVPPNNYSTQQVKCLSDIEFILFVFDSDTAKKDIKCSFPSHGTPTNRSPHPICGSHANRKSGFFTFSDRMSNQN